MDMAAMDMRSSMDVQPELLAAEAAKAHATRLARRHAAGQNLAVKELAWEPEGVYIRTKVRQ